MKKYICKIGIILLFFSSYSIDAQSQSQMEEFDEFLMSEGGFEEIEPPGSAPCDYCPGVEDFSFAWGGGFNTAFNNLALLEAAKQDNMTNWYNTQKELIKDHINAKLNKSFGDFDEAKNEWFSYSEIRNINKNTPPLVATYQGSYYSGLYKNYDYLKELKLLQLREAEISAGNIDNSQYGFLEINGVALKDMKELNSILQHRKTIEVVFGDNTWRTYEYKFIAEKLNFLGSDFDQYLLDLKNSFYNSFSNWDKLGLMQFLLNYEYYKEIVNSGVWVLPVGLQRFRGADMATPTVIEEYAKNNRGGDVSLFDPRYPIRNRFIYQENFCGGAIDYELWEQHKTEALDKLVDDTSISGLKITNLIKELKIDIDAQKDWLYGHATEAGKIDDFLDAHRSGGVASADAKSFAKEVVDILRDTKNISALNTTLKNENFITIIGNTLQSRNQNLYTELNTVFNEYNPSSLLSLNEMQIASQKTKEIYDIAGKDYNLNFNDINQFSIVERRIILENSVFLSIFPTISSIGQYWPKNAEEWAVIGNLFEQFLPELLLGFIPGSSIIDVIKGFNSGDTVAIALGLAGVLVDAFGGSIFKGLAKAGKIIYKVFKSFKTLYKFIRIVKKALVKGYKLVLEGDVVKFFRKSDNVHIASSLSNVLTLKFPAFGGDIVSHHSKTSTLLGKFLEGAPNGTDALIKSGLTESISGVTSKTTFNVLNDPNFTGWITNQTWLDDAIARSDIFRAISDPKNIGNVFYNIGGIDPTKFSNINTMKNYLLNLTSDEINQLSYYGREIRHLFQNGYTFDSLTKQFIK